MNILLIIIIYLIGVVTAYVFYRRNTTLNKYVFETDLFIIRFISLGSWVSVFTMIVYLISSKFFQLLDYIFFKDK